MTNTRDKDLPVEPVADPAEFDDVAGSDLGETLDPNAAPDLGQAAFEQVGVGPGLEFVLFQQPGVLEIEGGQADDGGQVAGRDVARGLDARISGFQLQHLLPGCIPGIGFDGVVLGAGLHRRLEFEQVAAVGQRQHRLLAQVGRLHPKRAVVGDDQAAVGLGPRDDEIPVDRVKLDHLRMREHLAVDIGIEAGPRGDLFDHLAVGDLVEISVLATYRQRYGLVFALDLHDRRLVFAHLDPVPDDHTVEQDRLVAVVARVDLNRFARNKLVGVADLEILGRRVAVEDHHLRRGHLVDGLRHDHSKHLIFTADWGTLDEYLERRLVCRSRRGDGTVVAHTLTSLSGGNKSSCPTSSLR